MDLKEFRAAVLRLDRPDEVLRLADMYLQDMEKKGDQFILPREHALVKPVLEYYAGDLEGWTKFVKSIRDRLPVIGRKYHSGVHELYRILNVRLVQAQRRERLDAAVAVAVKKRLINNDYDDKVRYAKRCQQVWERRLKQLMQTAHTESKTGRVSMDVGEALRLEFWKELSAEIENGEVPKP